MKKIMKILHPFRVLQYSVRQSLDSSVYIRRQCGGECVQQFGLFNDLALFISPKSSWLQITTSVYLPPSITNAAF